MFSDRWTDRQTEKLIEDNYFGGLSGENEFLK